MADPLDWIKQAEEVGLKLRESITEARQLLKDIKTDLKEFERRADDVRLGIRRDIDDHVQGFIDTYLSSVMGPALREWGRTYLTQVRERTGRISLDLEVKWKELTDYMDKISHQLELISGVTYDEETRKLVRRTD